MLRVFDIIPIVHPNSILVVTINGIGFVIEDSYIIIFFLYATNKKRLRVLAVRGVEATFMVIVAAARANRAEAAASEESNGRECDLSRTRDDE